jgi:hypothetical protein
LSSSSSSSRPRRLASLPEAQRAYALRDAVLGERPSASTNNRGSFTEHLRR